MRIDLIAERIVRDRTKVADSTRRATTHAEVDTRILQIPESYESGFLLDWLAGGVACERNIRGFSFKFDTLNFVVRP
jgi:hypothetical protein